MYLNGCSTGLATSINHNYTESGSRPRAVVASSSVHTKLSKGKAKNEERSLLVAKLKEGVNNVMYWGIIVLSVLMLSRTSIHATAWMRSCLCPEHTPIYNIYMMRGEPKNDVCMFSVEFYASAYRCTATRSAVSLSFSAIAIPVS